MSNELLGTSGFHRTINYYIPFKSDVASLFFQLREEFEDDPELYGLRRSGRCRKEPFRFKPPEVPAPEARSRRRKKCISDSSSECDRSSDSSLDDRWNGKSCRPPRTRGNRVNYKSAFVDESDDEGDDRPAPSNTRVYPALSQGSQQTSFQKPKGPLVRKLYSTKLTPRQQYESKQSTELVDRSDANTQFSEEEVQENQLHDADWCEDEEADVIEEVLAHAVRRKGATGNPTTLYNTKLEKDLNANFDPSKEPGELQFLIKWRNWSHIHSTWETEASLRCADRGCAVYGMKKLYAYQAVLKEKEDRMRYAERDDLETMAYEEERSEQLLAEKMDVERIVAHSRDPETNTYDYLVKWFRLDYRYCSWESGKVIRALYLPAVECYERRCRSTAIPDRKCEVLYNRPKFVALTEQPDYLGDSVNLRLRDYQLEGINWIARSWCRNNSVILADEMGLGKTIQTIGFLSYLFYEHNLFGPFLIVVPLSTVSSWQKELQAWAPKMNAIMYIGDHISRQLIREHEWCAGGTKRQQVLKFTVCVTTYEILLKDKSWLSQVPWSFLGVDEAHRLKNDASQLYKTLQTFETNTRLLITGTPLQNTMKELWALLHFIMPEKFPDWDEFERSYSVTADDPADRVDGEAFQSLHKVLRPFLLRRVKKDVESSLPEKIERILRVDMTKEQANIYRLILARNYDGLMKVTRGHKASFINIVMELKKCCNHAHLIAPPQETERYKMSNEEYLSSLIRGSGKMTLLDKLLQRLKSKGHRVLIFSQMVRMLDLIADYLSLRGWGFQRLDGSIRGALRKQALDHFNAEGSTDFCFLLSTRAGGLGINLATADTVIIFDSDWNPQNDLQAQARAHRIGQTKQVSVYRLVMQDSVEEKIIESATRKMVLDHLIIQRMDSAGGKNPHGRKGDTAKGQLLTEILRYGAEGLFKQLDEDAAELEVDIDDILNRAETRDADATAEANPANALLSSFKVVALDTLDEDADSNQAPNIKPEVTWDEIIPSELRGQLKAEEMQKTLIDLDLGPRRRKQVKTYQAGLDPGGSSDDSSEVEGENKQSATHLSEKEIRALVRAIKRFARPLERIDAIAADAELPDRTEKELFDVVDAILKGCQTAMQLASSTSGEDHQKQTGKGPVFQYGRVSVAAKPLLQSLEYLEVLHRYLPAGGKEARMTFELPFSPKLVVWSCPWDDTDDVRLLAGVYEHGYDNWEAIKLDADLGLGSKLLPVSPTERPQANHIRSRVDYLLKMLSKHYNRTPHSNSPDNHQAKKRKHQDPGKGSDMKLRCTDVHKKRRASAKSVQVGSLTSAPQPKSDEFVATEDSSSDSDEQEYDRTSDTTCVKRTKQENSMKDPKHEHKPNPKKNEAGVKPESECNHSASGVRDLSLQISKFEEEEFRKMRGPLFLECKEKLLPIKKHFKHLEHLEDAPEEDTKQFSKVILRIGDHIHDLVRGMEDKNTQRSWKGYLWDFVQIFSKKSTEDLRRIYRRAVKRRFKNSDATSGISDQPVTSENSSALESARKHHHRHHSRDADNKRNDRNRSSHHYDSGPFIHRDRYTRDRLFLDPVAKLLALTFLTVYLAGTTHRFAVELKLELFNNAFNRPPMSFGTPQHLPGDRDRPFISQRNLTREPHPVPERHSYSVPHSAPLPVNSAPIPLRPECSGRTSIPPFRPTPASSTNFGFPTDSVCTGTPLFDPLSAPSAFRDPRLKSVKR
ncbi:hypothetical protein EG68_02092 [Paragonimus skrjabini miyazakii]|uniref:DNA helicase n=1 Tax=Paragonimus skrjabini miyazakii TaxID=59628 RepID=A0A8S9Z0G1_9TREM|nr:hypothetical protein EG68_02092 [Paragonimus skrjabini miyazakii]